MRYGKRIPAVALAALGMIYSAFSASAAPAGPTAAAAAPRGLETAIFAGGCFWSMEYAFEKVYGVVDAVSGYAGGTTDGPDYHDYEAGGHAESVQVIYDPSRLSYAELLDVYWRNTDPADGGGQFVDRGPGYRPIVFADSGERRKEAEASKAKLAASGAIRAPIATEIRGAADFWPAERYHQDYARLNKEDYDSYRRGSGRPAVLSRYWGASALADPSAPPAKYGAVWKKPSAAELRKKLTPMQYEVTQREGTEPAYDNEYWDEHRPGIYVDIVSGEPLFSSADKFDSGTGWPSFSLALVPANIVHSADESYGMVRIEARSLHARSHLGHLFDDGPDPTGLRYCMDSASLRFVPKERMQAEGYGSFLRYVP